jgi:hypothetical protein
MKIYHPRECLGSLPGGLRYLFAVHVMIWGPRLKSDRLTHEHNIRLSILLQNRLRPVSLIDEISMISFYVNVIFAIYCKAACEFKRELIEVSGLGLVTTDNDA